MTEHPENEVTLMHRDDGSGCTSTVRNDAGTLWCTEHGRAVWGSGWFEDHLLALAGCLCHEGRCLCVVQCPAPGCGGVQHGPDGTALDADGRPVR